MIKGDLFIHANETIIYIDKETWYNFRQPGDAYPYFSSEKLPPRAPITVGSWVRKERLHPRSILLRVSRISAHRWFDHDLVYINRKYREPTEMESTSKSMNLWVPVEAPPKTPDFLPGDLAIAHVMPFTIIEIYDNHYMVEDEHNRFFAKGPLRHKPLEVGDWARHVPNGEGSILRLVDSIYRGRFESKRLKHAGGFEDSFSRGHSTETWVAIKSPPETNPCSEEPLVIVKSETRRMTLEHTVIRAGWDNITYRGSLAYLHGGIIVYKAGGYWCIKHPNPHLTMNEYHTATLAMEDVEQWLK